MKNKQVKQVKKTVNKQAKQVKKVKKTVKKEFIHRGSYYFLMNEDVLY